MNSAMSFAYGYFNSSQTEIEGDMNIACVTYENVVSCEESWKKDEVVWILGRKFKLPDQREKFLQFVKSKLWVTYRKGFSAIGGTGPTCDAGWGCMLRCGQMLLAQALSVISVCKERQWEFNQETQHLAYKKILKTVADERTSCYSIHQIAQMGVLEGKEVGQWFGPNTVSQVLKRLSRFDQENDLAFYVAMDNTVCIKDIEKLCTSPNSQDSRSEKSSSKSNTDNTKEDYSFANSLEHAGSTNVKSADYWKPLFLMVPLRLGLSEINQVYFTHLKEVLKWEETVGVIGGKPNHAYYFIGCSDDYLVYLDPHTTQPYVKFPDLESGEKFEDESYHCDCPSKMPLCQLDPSLALGFLCSKRTHFENMCRKVRTFEKTSTSYPLFEIMDSFPQYNLKESRVLSVKSHSRLKRNELKEGRKLEEDDICLALDTDDSLASDDEFEILEFE